MERLFWLKIGNEAYKRKHIRASSSYIIHRETRPVGKDGVTMARKQSGSLGSLMAGLEETDRALAAVQAGFQETADQDLLEYYLYSRCALRAKHSYLLRQLRLLEKEAST